MERYLAKCLDSLLIPNMDSVEIIVVNDGSKDKSSEIAHSYAERYPNSIIVIDKPNGNYGSCINTALPITKGRYIKILDADDSFDNRSFSSFVDSLSNVDADVILTRCRELDEKGSTIGITGCFKKVRYDRVYENINDFMPDNTLMHWITYNRKVFDRFEYFQPEGVSYTDNIWAFIPIIHCKTGIFKDITLYNYLLGREGQTMSPAQLKGRISHFITVADCMADYYVKFNGISSLSKITTRNCLAVITCIYNLIMRFKSEENLKHLRDFDISLKLKAPALYHAIGEYNIQKNIHYKIYRELRKADYNMQFKVPKIIMFRRNLLLHIHGLNIRLKRILKLH